MSHDTPSIRVMLVEDERIIAWEMEERLRTLGCIICASVSSGEEALEILHSAKPDLIFMDIMLNGRLDGIETTKAVQSRGTTPVIYCTSYSGEIRQRAEETNPYAFLNKPLDYSRVNELLNGLKNTVN